MDADDAEIQANAIDYLLERGLQEAANILRSCELELTDANDYWYDGNVKLEAWNVQLLGPIEAYDVLKNKRHIITVDIREAIDAVLPHGMYVKDHSVRVKMAATEAAQTRNPEKTSSVLEATQRSPQQVRQENSQKWHVFLSYSGEDVWAMRCVLHDLVAAGLDVWVAPINLVPGTPQWRTEIVDGIKNSSRFVVLLSPDAYKSKWVNEEIACAEENEKPSWPFIVRGRDGDEIVPLGMKGAQRFDARPNYETEAQRLIARIKQELQITDTTITWEKTADLYWIVVDINATQKELSQGANMDFEYVNRGLRQAQHHARQLRMTNIVQRFQALRSKVDGPTGTQWLRTNISAVNGALSHILDLISKLAEENQPGFDAGPG